MFNGFTTFDLQTGPDITIHGIKGGSGPPLLLLHGFPQTHHIFHKIADQLTQKYTVIIPDLRGYGKSSKPAGGPPNHEAYSKTNMAKDMVEIMKQLGYKEFLICAHDRGGRVAHQLCINHPDAVQKCMVLDICPTLAMYNGTDFDFAKAYAHWFYLIQPDPVPEMMLAANPRSYLECVMGGRQQKALSIFHPQVFDEYVANFDTPEGIHAMCEDYRAAATVDLEEQRRDRKEGKKIQCPLRVLWGVNGVVEKKFDALKEWKEVCSNEVSGEATQSGHYIPEEAPEELLKHIKEFLVV